MRDSCSSLKNILHSELSSLQARLTRKQRIKLSMQILALGCPAAAHHRFSLYPPQQARGSRCSVSAFKASRAFFHPPGGPLSLEESSVSSRNGASSEGPLKAGTNRQLLLWAELPGMRPHRDGFLLSSPCAQAAVKAITCLRGIRKWKVQGHL